MTAYSFGARWVGVVALRDSPEPEPLHRMALRLRGASRTRILRVDRIDIPADELLRVLSGIRFRQSLAGQAARARECLRVEQGIRAGSDPEIRSWLRTNIVDVLGGTAHPGASTTEPSRVDRITEKREGGLDRSVATGWASAYPQAPESPWLPPLGDRLADEIERLGLKLDEEAARWLRWSCLHVSYLHEVPDNPVGAGVLQILAMLGRGWVRLAMLDRARDLRGEFASNDEVTAVLKGEQQVRVGLGAWVGALGAGFYGKGEASLLSAGRRSTAPQTVAMQILGALSLVTASQVPADLLLEAIGYRAPASEPDWLTILGSELKVQPEFDRRDEGPDHDKTYTVTVTAAGRSATASAGSVKAARNAALREYVTRYFPRAVPKLPAKATLSRPRPYPAHLFPRHAQAVEWAQRAFEVAEAGLMTQALTHRSWVHENAALVAEAHQRDYGTLAAEGAEILTHLVRHHHALQLLGASLHRPIGHDITPPVTGQVVAELFDAMPIAGGVLRSRVLAQDVILASDLKADVAQAVAAAAWRANGDLLAERQPSVLAGWIRSFTPPPDPIAQLDTYCSRVKVAFTVDFDERGPDHGREYRATIRFEIDGRPAWRGGWYSGKAAAKQSAVGGVVDYLLGDTKRVHGEGSHNGAAIVQGLLLAELRAINPVEVKPQRELANGTLGVDLLAAGDYGSYTAWSSTRSTLIPPGGSAVADRLAQFYEAVLIPLRRDAIRQWIVRHTPARGLESTEPAARIRSWWAGTDPGLLVLLEDLLPRLRDPDPSTAILDYIETQARAVAIAAGTELETERAHDQSARSLTLRIDGAELSEAFEPVVRLIESVGVGAAWTREPQALSVAISPLPDGGNPIEVAAIGAVKNAFNDPWLTKVHTALGDFLAATERILGSNGELSPERMDELSLTELSLILQLRSNGEEDE